jgi:hypothetical protein
MYDDYEKFRIKISNKRYPFASASASSVNYHTIQCIIKYLRSQLRDDNNIHGMMMQSNMSFTNDSFKIILLKF